MRFISRTATRLLFPAALGVTLVVMGVVLAIRQPISWLPAAGEAEPLLGTLLTAQAAIVALTLAVTIFVMQGPVTRRDIDDRMYHEYVGRSWVWQVFLASVIAVAATGLVLLTERFEQGTLAVVNYAPGLRNLALVATVSFFVSLMLAVVLFWRAIHLVQPEQWRVIRRHVNERDVRESIQVFLRRYRRAGEALAGGEPDISSMVPDAREGLADEAVRTLSEDARRAMDERRQRDFTLSLDAMRGLVELAVDELASENFTWGTPGSQPEWPPLRNLGSNLDAFREEVLRRGSRDHVLGLVFLDLWFMYTGWHRHCGEMFTVGLDGHRRNREIARRVQGAAFQAGLSDRLQLLTGAIVSGVASEEAFLYLRQVLRHQERLLSDAMNAGSSAEFEQTHRESEAILLGVRSRWLADSPAWADASGQYEELARDYRITLMGLGGRAMILADEGRLDDPAPYLDVVRSQCNNLRQLAEDVARILPPQEQVARLQWFGWEMDGTDEYRVRPLRLERYPLTLFAVRLMELANASMPALDFHGNAQQVLNWFENNVSRLEIHVREAPDMSVGERRILATDALRAAVRTDAMAADHEVIERELSAVTVETFASEVKAAFATNPIEQLFERAGAIIRLSSDADGRPDERGFHRLEPKAAFATVPENASAHYEALQGGEWGRGLSGDVMMQQLGEALSEAPQTEVPMDATEALLRAIDEVAENLSPSAQLAIVLVGDWHDVLVDLSVNRPNGYEFRWQIPEADRCGEEGRYRGHLLIRGSASDRRMAYVVEPKAWGSFVRAEVEDGEDILVSVDSVSAERARDLLDLNPDYFRDEPDEASKLRKLQTCVEVVVVARTAFRVVDPSRALRIVDVRRVTAVEAGDCGGEDEPEGSLTLGVRVQSFSGALIRRLWQMCRHGKSGSAEPAQNF